MNTTQDFSNLYEITGNGNWLLTVGVCVKELLVDGLTNGEMSRNPERASESGSHPNLVGRRIRSRREELG